MSNSFGLNLGIPATVVYGQQCILYSGSVGSQLRRHQQQRPLQGFAEDHMGWDPYYIAVGHTVSLSTFYFSCVLCMVPRPDHTRLWYNNLRLQPGQLYKDKKSNLIRNLTCLLLKSVSSNFTLAVHSPNFWQAKSHFLSHFGGKREKQYGKAGIQTHDQ